MRRSRPRGRDRRPRTLAAPTAHAAAPAGAARRAKSARSVAARDRRHPAAARSSTLVLAALALALGIATFMLARPRLAVRAAAGRSASALVLANLSVLLLLGAVLAGAADAGLGRAAARLGRLAPACPAGAAVQRGGGAPDHRRRRVRHRVLPFRHPGLVQRPGAHRARRVAAGRARLSRGTSATTSAPSRWRWPTTSTAPARCSRRSRTPSPGAGDADRAARPDRGGDLRPVTGQVMASRRPARRARRRAAAGLGHRARPQRRRRGDDRRGR